MEKVGVRCSDMRSAPRTNQTTKITSMKAAKAIPALTEKDKARFWSKVAVAGPDECWEWQAGKSGEGYGQFKVQGSFFYSHRIAFALSGGRFEAGPLVCHGPCNNRLCVNPSHLSAGTSKSNTHDMFRDGTVSKGEAHSAIIRRVAARGDRNSSTMRPERLPRGEAHHNAKLTADDAGEIRRRYALGGITQRELAEEFSVPQPAISRIIHRKRWQHVA